MLLLLLEKLSPKSVLGYSFFFFLFKGYQEHLFKTEVQLTYNTVLVSGVQQNVLVTYIYTHTHTHTYFQLFSTIGYYKILTIVFCTIQ